MSIFSIFNKNKKDDSKQLTLEEKWNNDSESYNNPNYKPQTGETQCYNCIYINKNNIFKCPKVGDVSKEILKGERKCDYRKEKFNKGLFDKNDLKKENFILNEDLFEFECEEFKLAISEEIYDNDTYEYAKKIINKYLNDRDIILNHMLEVGLRDIYKNNFDYSDEYIKNEIGKPEFIINFKKDNNHPQWSFEYAGIINYCESNLDEHLISIEFSDDLLLDDNIQLNG